MKTSNALDFKNEKERKQFRADVEKEQIQEYRKASAEKLGLKEWAKDSLMVWIVKDVKYTLWHPDKDANQREMIEDWLIEQGYFITMHRSQAIKKTWAIAIGKDETLNHFYKGEDKSKSVAFMKAFMEYIKQKT